MVPRTPGEDRSQSAILEPRTPGEIAPKHRPHMVDLRGRKKSESMGDLSMVREAIRGACWSRAVRGLLALAFEEWEAHTR